jgi:hypothetical protein
MNTLAESFSVALAMITHLDPRVTAIVALSLGVSLTSTVCSAVIGLPLGAAVAIGRFPGRGPLIVALERRDGPAARRGGVARLPPVVARRTARFDGSALHAAGRWSSRKRC